MIAQPTTTERLSPAALRLSRLVSLTDTDLVALNAAEQEARLLTVRREILSEHRPIPDALLLLSGWAVRVRLVPDGRRQFLSFLLPGDLIGYSGHANPLAAATVTALTDVTVATAPPAISCPNLREAYEVSRALDEAYLLAQILRLGRMNAQERLADFILELRDRLDLAGMVSSDGFAAPMTQETLGDALGLTSVHINRTLRTMRLEGDLIWKNGIISLPRAAALSARIGHTPAKVVAR